MEYKQQEVTVGDIAEAALPMSNEADAQAGGSDKGAEPAGKQGFRLFGGDTSLWIIIIALAIISLLVVYSATNSIAYSQKSGDTSFFVLNQARFIIIGFFAIFVIHRFNFQTYARYSHLLFYLAIGLMLLTFVIGESTNDAARSLRFFGVTFQPADFLKVTLIMVLAKELGRRQKEIKRIELLPVIPMNLKMSEKRKEKNWYVWRTTTRPILMPVVVTCGLVFISNFSTAALIFVSCLIMFYVSRVNGRELWRLIRITFVTVLVAVAVMYAFGIGRSEVWINRMGSFIGIEKAEMTPDEKAVRERNENQVENAKMAIASGAITGLGPGKSIQRSNLPLPFSDYAYAFIVEEYGMVGAIVVLALYLWLFFRTIVIFRRCKKSFPSLLVLGLGIMIVVQAFVSMMVAVGLFPVTGLPLPYISLGGSSVLFTSIAFGMILGVSRQMQEKTLTEGQA